MRFWDASTGKMLHDRKLAGAAVRQMAFLPDGKTLVLACSDGSLRFWDPATATERRKVKADPNQTMSVACSSDGKRLATQGLEGKLTTWDATTGKTTATIPVANQAGGVCFVAAEQLLAVAEGGSVCLRDLATGKERTRTNSHNGPVSSLAASPDGTTIAWADGRATIHLARIVDGKLRVVEPEKLLPLALAFAGGGKELVTAGDRVLRIWDPEAGREVRRWSEQGQAVVNLARSPDGKTLALVGADRVVRLADAATGRTRWSLPAAERARWTPSRFRRTARCSPALTTTRCASGPHPPGRKKAV